jgi:dienelactone hydrolase
MSDADIRTEEVVYSAGGLEMHGYIAWDASMEGRRPGILVAPEFWGRNDYACRRARELAGLGYTGMAVDMYGGGKVAADAAEATACMNAIIGNMEEGRSRFAAALELLRNHDSVDPARVGAIGYCFGGGLVLHMARMGMDLNVVGSFHGSLPLAIAPGPDAIDARVAVYNGEDDGFVPADDIAAFKREMAAVGAHYDFIQLPGALHGFSNPEATAKGEKFGLPLRYDELADQVSWGHMQMVFREVFGV